LARANTLAFTDSDCRPEPDWLKEGLSALSACDFAGGAMEVLVDDPSNMTPVEAFERVFAFDNQTYVRRRGFTVTANLFCPRYVFDRVGGFATTRLPEDLEWCERARSAGFKIGYAPKSIVGHPARRTWSDLVRKASRLNAQAFGLMTRRPGGKLIWLARSVALPLSAVVHTPKALTGRGLQNLGQRFAAVAVLYRLRLWRFVDSIRLLLSAPR
jgi:GT2 family glycosyltransferase